ncbi:fumarylacetoacetate hydrolase family protein [Bacillus sp. B-jedd]|uniref:fumarylacetoacetate hydrolase family protein n=1 Tax=Bacillus sp. B-jedd TaxID=1476857 RepID=UPI0005156A95|nr:fumarylacetoacetate hydrolase family protein [Bacillus sp. B-jedd]CEG26056.1 fumarylacetoacetate hydrolase family protein [Bacillus sp. B-jedd]
MKLATINYKDEMISAYVDTSMQSVLPLKKAAAAAPVSVADFPVTVLDIINAGPDVLNRIGELARWAETDKTGLDLWIPLDEAELVAPIPRPQKNIFCVGKNYADHAIEMGGPEDIPEHIMVFTKPPTAVIGPDAEIPAHTELTDQLDYEGELAIVIGKKGAKIKKEDALEYVFGYTILNDITARDLQKRHRQFFLGKSLDGTCPMGPWIVTADEVGNAGNLNVSTRVNNETRQDSNTRHFIFSIEQMIEDISRGLTLEPGDIIATGTPAGVGKGFKPPKFLRPGDVIEIEIEKIGSLKNTIAK